MSSENNFWIWFVHLLLAADATTFWQVTDLHWDRLYSRTGDPIANCHGFNVTVDNGDYGNIRCDTNTKLYRSALRAMSVIEPEPRFILWTGDSAPHLEYPDQTWSDVYDTLANSSSLLRRHFPATPIFPVLGNHDTVPSGQFPSNDTEFYSNFLVNGTWSDFITDDDSRETFLRGGYYSKAVVSDALRVVVINTCLYLLENRLVNETEDDPSGQFAWMRVQLEDARRLRHKVLITSHVAPGYYATSSSPTLHMKPTFNDRLVRLLANQSDVVAAALFGHEHLDSFRLIADVDGGDFKVPAFIAPPVNPWIPSFLLGKASVNPGLRLYVYDDTRGVVQDYHQFYLNYTEANHNASEGTECQEAVASVHQRATEVPTAACICVPDDDDADCAEWRLLYRPTVEYDLPDLSLNSVVDLYEKLASSQSLFDVFADHIHLDYVVAECDDRCRHDVFCSFVNITEAAMEACLSGAALH